MPGVVQIPVEPQVGRNAIRIELDASELGETLRLLTLAVKAFEDKAGAPVPAEPQPAPQAIPFLTQIPVSRLASPAQRTPNLPANHQPALPPQSFAAPPPQNFTAPPQSVAPPPPSHSQPESSEASSFSFPTVVSPHAHSHSFPPANQQLQKPAEPAPAALNGVVSGGVKQIPPQASPWKRCWVTAAEEHNRHPVTAMLYSSSYQGLADGDGHAGWLVSASNRLLNLWECNAGGGVAGEPSLQVMHSQVTDYQVLGLDRDPQHQLLVSAAQHHQGSLCVTLHSLSGDNFFAYKGLIRVTDPAKALSLSQNHKQAGVVGLPLMHLASLNPHGGPLKTSVITTIATDVYVYDITKAAGTAGPLPTLTKATWRAHDGQITAVHRSPFGISLLTAASDGNIRIWDLRAKPSAPATQFQHGRSLVTGLDLLDPNRLASTSADGTICLWDIRGAASATQTLTPDQKAVTRLSASPLKDALAITTGRGLYCLELSETSDSPPACCPLAPLPPVGPSLGLRWNERTGEIYVSNPDGTITVYHRK